MKGLIDVDYLAEYTNTKSWVRKAIIMNLLHSDRKLQGKWSITLSAQFFSVSIGLVSENLRLAKFFDSRPELMKMESRQQALTAIERRQIRRDFVNNEDTD